MLRGVSPVSLLLVNPPEGIMSGDGVSIVLAATAPIAPSSVNAVAIGGGASDAMIASLVRALRGGGRMVGPVTMALPDNLVEITRDSDLWVARLDAEATVSAPILPTRRSR
jgi:protein-L-isoaspartate O-methyltransferase